MKIFNYTTLLAAASLTAFHGQITAATVELKNGDTLSGSIKQYNSDALTLDSSVSDQALEVENAAIKRILFPKSNDSKPKHSELLTLVNGDILPCKILNLTDDAIKISTEYAGDFSISRQHLGSLQFGMHDHKVIFRADDSISDWSKSEGQWTKTSNSSISCKGTGTLARKLDLPESMRISYMLSWKGTPNFVFRFCGENNSATTRQDSYEFLFNSGGMQLRRFESDNHPGAPLANIPLKPSTFNGRKVNLDFIVDRKNQEITLMIDGDVIGKYPDQLGAAAGDYIIFNSRSSKNNFTISNLLITESASGPVNRHRENVRIANSDVLISSMGDKLSGKIKGITMANDGKRTLQMQQLNADKNINVPEKRVSSIHFLQKENADQTNQKSTHTILLEGGGKLRLTNPAISEGNLQLNHPILGKIQINSKSLQQIVQNDSEE